jgi:hypothetical protein
VNRSLIEWKDECGSFKSDGSCRIFFVRNNSPLIVVEGANVGANRFGVISSAGHFAPLDVVQN